ncbi:D-alanine--D-alanine ligase [Shewanella sp. NIFS-20-20]|uniref:D-alanine--D-alanine ligase n=1 Tax=Shewanella sp. NIFS-20-20 TaxID=2853806 RepID=UPI001C43B168|nr:D-alanine--D-alanine ligase [Shewanella sp. NIFS-20-20]MBV7315081.1 D-alanine--D-alanine ligase [Shewanella sp. NIFS-20-20]
MTPINLLLICGGGSSEHAISLMSAAYLKSNLESIAGVNLMQVEMLAGGQYQTLDGKLVQLNADHQLVSEDPAIAAWKVDYVVPCIHGYPGETGDIQSWLDLINLPYFGCQGEASINCFNKVTAKMWFSALGIPNTPSLFLDELSPDAIRRTEDALQQWGSIFVKAASQGSSVGCYKVDDPAQIPAILSDAFRYSPYVIVEKTIIARELEVAVYEYQGEIVASLPGEIVCASNTFYSFDEKYNSSSQAITHVVAPNLSTELSDTIRRYAIKAFSGMKLRHLSRIDFFLTADNEILLNEINTFPGMTPISMFPKMLINNGHDFAAMLESNIRSQV